MSENNELYFIAIDSVREILNTESNKEFKKMLLESFSMLKDRGFLKYNEVKKEISEMRKFSINIDDYRSDDVEVGMYQRIMNDIDQQRSRISDIMSNAQADLFWIDETYKMLFSIWVGRYSALTSDKKREGEAESILYFLFSERLKRREVYDIVKNKFNLLNSKIDVISRKVTIAMEMRKSYSGHGNVYNTEGPYRAVLSEEPKKNNEAKKKVVVKDSFKEVDNW